MQTVYRFITRWVLDEHDGGSKVLSWAPNQIAQSHPYTPSQVHIWTPQKVKDGWMKWYANTYVINIKARKGWKNWGSGQKDL